jgi:tRNA G10  N-methylase Trm11
MPGAIREVLGRDAIHPFPARMAPPIALRSLAQLPPGAIVLDPMMGSGTVLAVARSLGLRGVGTDVDPLAVLHASVWTTTLDARETVEAGRRVLRKAIGRLALRGVDPLPEGVDEETGCFMRYWFDLRARRQLIALAMELTHVTPTRTRDALWCAFSRMIIAKDAGVSRARDLSHSRPHRAYKTAPVVPFDVFERAVFHVSANCIDKSQRRRGPQTRTLIDDARQCRLPSDSVDAVVTSPPYLNAIDYMRCSKYSLVWMGYPVAQLRAIRAGSVGTEVGEVLSEDTHTLFQEVGVTLNSETRDARIVSRYAQDMTAVLTESRRVLKKSGKAVLVVGESTLRGTFVPTAKLVGYIATRCGFEVVGRQVRALPPNRRYLPPPPATSGAMSTRMSREVILTLQCV